MRAMGFETVEMRKYWRTIHLYKDHYYEYGCRRPYRPHVQIIKNGAQAEQKLFHEKKEELDRVMRVVIEMEKVIKGFGGEIPEWEVM